MNDVETLDTITLYFTRLVLGVQLVLAGVQLPSKYLKTEWKSLSLLLGPGMTVMWLVTSLLVFALVPHISFLHALAVGACVTPTDPVLSNSIVKGKFADKNIPKELQKIIVAESGANDGLGYPFLFLPLFLIKHIGHGCSGMDRKRIASLGRRAEIRRPRKFLGFCHHSGCRFPDLVCYVRISLTLHAALHCGYMWHDR